MLWRNSTYVLILVLGFEGAAAFAPPLRLSSLNNQPTWLEAKKKRRRRNPVPDGGTTASPDLNQDEEVEKEEVTEEELAMMKDLASYEFKPGEPIDKRIENEVATDEKGNDIVLPDIKDSLKTKQLREEIARMEEEEKKNRPRIKRSDREAFIKLYSSQPFADADASYFEEEEYGVVSALLGENAASFLGIPPGPLQVGHFIGALGIALMAFVEYPGFPLTNLPTPLRDSFQGGLATIYLTNTVLAVLSVFKALERGQSAPLWAAKTFSVGGLALDQLTQLPTLEEIKAAEAKKGKRALKNRK